MDRQVYEFISKQNNDPIVERRVCEKSGENFPIYQSDMAFYEKLSPMIVGKKIALPLPTISPAYRQQMRLTFRNDKNLYRTPCQASGKLDISMISPDKPYKVYDQKIWRGDNRDALDYGIYFDVAKTFTEQFHTLMLAVPHTSLFATNSENCEYANFALQAKNVYLSAGVTLSEDCYYSHFVTKSTTIVDCTSLFQCENCYEGVSSLNCYKCLFFANCDTCSDCLYVEDCIKCDHCIGCIGLSGKTYRIFNQSASKEEYDYRKRIILNHKTVSVFLEKYTAIQSKAIYPDMHVVGSERCLGDLIIESTDCRMCYDIKNCEMCRYLANDPNSTRSMDGNFGAPEGTELMYNFISCMGARGISDCMCRRCRDIYYSYECSSCQDCFGCVGLKNKQYCIFNTQYTKETYEQEVLIIIAHMEKTKEWGEFFHPSLSMFGYNETLAQDYFPLQKSATLALSYQWSDYTLAAPQVDKCYNASELPNTITDVSDDILMTAILCEETGKPFRIITPELAFYRTMGIPLPHKHPDIRHRYRLRKRPGRSLYLDHCGKCGNDIVSIHPLTDKRTVYCTTCYQKEVFG